MSGIRERLRGFLERSADAARSDGGRNVWLYLLCVLIAFVFWILMSLDNEVQRDFEVPIELQDVPDSVTVISDLPPALSVGVKAKGSQLLRFVQLVSPSDEGEVRYAVGARQSLRYDKSASREPSS